MRELSHRTRRIYMLSSDFHVMFNNKLEYAISKKVSNMKQEIIEYLSIYIYYLMFQ
jgi:hypothetical protein